MSDVAKPELLRALGRMVRGLSILFWGLPACVVTYVQTARTDWLEFLGPWAFVPSMVLSAVLIYAFSRMRDFQKQERVWIQSLNRAELFAVVNTGLAPFLFWWRRFPFIPFYGWCVGALFFSVLLLLIAVNRMLYRLSAMLPDEALRGEAKLFVAFNIGLLIMVIAGIGCYTALAQLDILPVIVVRIMLALQQQGLWLAFFLTLIPFAMTLSLIWKLKETIFAAILTSDR